MAPAVSRCAGYLESFLLRRLQMKSKDVWNTVDEDVVEEEPEYAKGLSDRVYYIHFKWERHLR